MTTTNWNQLKEDHEVTYFRAGLCLDSPESYSLDEKRQICADMEVSMLEVEAAIRREFRSMPEFSPEAHARAALRE